MSYRSIATVCTISLIIASLLQEIEDLQRRTTFLVTRPTAPTK